MVLAISAVPNGFRSWPGVRREEGQDEIVNGFGVLEGLVELLARRHRVVRAAGITEGGDVGRENFSRGFKRIKSPVQRRGLDHQRAEVVGFCKRFIAPLQIGFHRLFASLLAVVNGDVQRRIFGGGGDESRRKSWCARFSQSLTSPRSASSIQLSALVQDLMEQGGAKVFVAVHFPPRPHEHVCWHGQPAQTTLRALVAPAGGEQLELFGA